MGYEPILLEKPGLEGETEIPCRYCSEQHTTRFHRIREWDKLERM